MCVKSLLDRTSEMPHVTQIFCGTPQEAAAIRPRSPIEAEIIGMQCSVNVEAAVGLERPIPFAALYVFENIAP